MVTFNFLHMGKLLRVRHLSFIGFLISFSMKLGFFLGEPFFLGWKRKYDSNYRLVKLDDIDA